MAVLSAAVQKASSFGVTRVEDALHQLDLNTLVGHVNYDSAGDLKEQRVYVFQVKEGAFVQVYPK